MPVGTREQSLLPLLCQAAPLQQCSAVVVRRTSCTAATSAACRLDCCAATAGTGMVSTASFTALCASHASLLRCILVVWSRNLLGRRGFTSSSLPLLLSASFDFLLPSETRSLVLGCLDCFGRSKVLPGFVAITRRQQDWLVARQRGSLICLEANTTNSRGNCAQLREMSVLMRHHLS